MWTVPGRQSLPRVVEAALAQLGRHAAGYSLVGEPGQVPAVAVSETQASMRLWLLIN
jgi:hypothetical protein